MVELVKKLNEVVWGVPALSLILGVGIYISIRTRFIQFRAFPAALRSFLRPFFAEEDKFAKSKQRALFTALAATVGTGNLAGVAGAIALGGPGSVFWMWMSGLLGMGTKLAEATLAVRYRKYGSNGQVLGGPMYMILDGMKKRWHWLAYIYAFFGVVASFGVGNGTQINTVVSGLKAALEVFHIRTGFLFSIVVGSVLAVIIYRVLSGGAAGIGRVAEKLVPFAALLYIILCFVVLVICRSRIPEALHAIVVGAFQPRAVTGGAVGSIMLSLRVGAARGVFTNEAGMGTAAMAHAQSSVHDPVEQGWMGVIEVFIDTIVICTLTALVILCSGVRIPYGSDHGIVLTNQAFITVCGGWVSVIIAACLCLLAFATVLGWGLYGMQCVVFLFGEGAVSKYIRLQVITVIISAVMQTETLWLMAETVNGLMAIPNLIMLARLTPELCEILKCHQPKQVASNQFEISTVCVD